MMIKITSVNKSPFQLVLMTLIPKTKEENDTVDISQFFFGFKIKFLKKATFLNANNFE